METEDGNEDVCGACTDIGDLICCESCPAAYHADCAGYGEACGSQTTPYQTLANTVCLQSTLMKSQQATGIAGLAASNESAATPSQP